MFTSRTSTFINASSMADIAFLMLCFFMMTTIMQEHKGLTLLLPPLDTRTAPVKNRNVFTIRINSHNQLMVQNNARENLTGVREEIKVFIMNNGADASLSENPVKAVVSFKADRGSNHKSYIAVLDEIQRAYYELYAERVGISAEAFRKLDTRIPSQNQLYLKGKAGVPMNISIAEL